MVDNNINLGKEKQFERLDSLVEKQGAKKEYAPETKESREGELIEETAEDREVDLSSEEKGEGGEMGGIVAVSRQRKAKQVRMKKIESVLEKGLDDIYLAMPKENREKFKQEGEKTVVEINDLFERGKATMKKIVNLIKKWLGSIPGINRFFIEQEAKIKTDEIINANIKND
ncbi:hypothetical protein KAI65_01290 [Candidatus Parcubacteria bacterium]|nr:hypothetical protein [Candidatus Parcubacteria bacterium]